MKLPLNHKLSESSYFFFLLIYYIDQFHNFALTLLIYCKLIDIMEKLDNHIFEAITQLRSNKKQPNESAIMTYLSEELEELNIDKKQLSERLKWLVKYKRLENKPRNGVNSYYNIRDGSQCTEPPLAPKSLDKPTLDKCPDKELEVTINHDTENTIYKLNLQIQNITTELEAIKMFVKGQFYLIKKSRDEIGHQSEPQRNKEFIELLQQQKKLCRRKQIKNYYNSNAH